MKKFFHKISKWILYFILIFIVFSILEVVVFRFAPIPRTPLMLLRSWQHRAYDNWETKYKWVPLSKISPQMTLAVIASEDNRFEKHNGFEWGQISKVLSGKEKRKRMRGASTISQQVAKNVFLWPGRSYFRKGLEAYYTILIELLWSKQRIMEVYLNVIEMGDGIYGAESAARYYYKKPAKHLTTSEAAMIAVCLPNPITRKPNKPTTYLRKRQQDIMSLMKKVAKPHFY